MGLSDVRERSRPEPGMDRVRFDGEEVTRWMADGRSEHVRWDELEEVGIITTDEGPFAEDVYWILVARGGNGGCAVPSGAEGADALLARLQELPGFDNEVVIRAMASTENARFVCWRRTE
jgi:hypothetical protein